MNDTAVDNERIVISYLALRKAIGVLGMALPFVLLFGGSILILLGIEESTNGFVQKSISDYFHTLMRGVFVGTMCAIGVFLFAYKGYDASDNRAGYLACICAIGLALLPTEPDPATSIQLTMGKVHMAFATGFFAVLAYFCLRLFTRSDPNLAATPQKLQRNRVYRACGYTIVAGILAIGALTFLPDDISTGPKDRDAIFWIEAAMVFAFGVSWFTKGEGILGDKPRDT